jgi:uncharacterized protein (DUF433 family)
MEDNHVTAREHSGLRDPPGRPERSAVPVTAAYGGVQRRRRANWTYTVNMDWSLCSAVDRDPLWLGGAWCFRGTRVPVASLFEHIDRGSTIAEFLEWFPSVTPQQVHAVLAFAKDSLELPAAVA